MIPNRVIPVKSCNCVSECNQALKNHQIFLRARKEVTRKHNKVNEKLGEKVFVFARMQKMEKIVLLYKGREVILEEDKVCSAVKKSCRTTKDERKVRNSKL